MTAAAPAACRPRFAACLTCIAGRAFTPAGEVCGRGMLRFCISAAPQGPVISQGWAAGEIARPTNHWERPAETDKRYKPHRPCVGDDARIVPETNGRFCPRSPALQGCGKPGGYWQGRVPHPSVAWQRQLPLQGSLPGGRRLIKPPLQGEVDAPQGADRGVHCRLAMEISCKARQCLALCLAGDDARIVPETLRRRGPYGPMKSSAPTRGRQPFTPVHARRAMCP